MIDIHIEVDDAKAQRYLTQMKARSQDFGPVFRKARERLEQANRANFTANGLPSGGWAPRRHRYTWPIMRRTGKLFRSLSNLRGAPNEIRPTSATFGTNVEYAKFHQHGTRKMPARLVVFEPVGFGRWVGEEAADHIIGARRVR